ATASGESLIHLEHKPIRRVFLRPNHPAAHPEALRAILDADLIVISAGSLFTSVLPNFLVEDLSRSVRNSRAAKVFVCNVATEDGETDGYHVSDHVRAFESHVGAGMFQYVLVNNNTTVNLSSTNPAHLVTDNDRLSDIGYNVVVADVIDSAEPRRHHPKKLAQSILRIYYDRDHFLSSRGIAREVEADSNLVRSEA
ncbi:MAG TPA: 2-phospho-L-lactate transferase CofD family protein, partial [Chloroflexota bacterium]|nr:2-phospho-L-lactate transferase CofD family protein [Chloroflexota bacterium]